MTAHLQLFMILGAIVLLLIIFALLKRGLMSVKYSLLWLAGLSLPLPSPMWCMCCATCLTLRCRSTSSFC